MGLEIPAEVQWLSWIVGSDWPEGDETAMRRCADAWRQAATSINDLVGDVTGSVNDVRGTLDAEAAEKFQKNVEQWITTDPRLLPSMADACNKLADVMDNGALDIEYAKYMFIALLIVTAIEIAMLIAAAFETFGASTAGIPAVEGAAQVTARTIFKELMEKLGYADEAALKAIDAEVKRIVAESAEFARTSPEPEAAALYADVYLEAAR